MSTQREWDDQAGMALGVGYDSVSCKVRGDAVKRTDPEGEGGEDVYFAINTVSSRRELAKFMNITAEASMRYAVYSGSGKTRYFEEQHINEFSIYIVVACVVQHTAKRMRDVELKDAAKQLLMNGNAERFHQAYGNEFLVGYTSGGEFYGVYELRTSSKDEHKQLSQTLKGSGGYGAWSGSGSAAFETAISKLSEIVSMTFEMFSYGGQANDPLPNTASELIEFARRFPQMVRGPAAKKYSATFIGYDTLDLPDGPNFIDLTDKRDVLEWLGTQRLRYLDVIASIEYVLFNHEQFEPFDSAELNSSVNQLRKAVDDITQAASKCVNDYRHCERITLPDPAIQLPERRDSSVIGAIKLVKEASSRAEQHGIACNDHVKKVLEISRNIRTGPNGKPSADKAKTELANARSASRLAERAYEDALTTDRIDSVEIDQFIASAKSWVKRSKEDVALAETKYDSEIYPIGYSPYWKAPTLVLLAKNGSSGSRFDPYVPADGYVYGWGCGDIVPDKWRQISWRMGTNTVVESLDADQARQKGAWVARVSDFAADPCGGEIRIRSACGNLGVCPFTDWPHVGYMSRPNEDAWSGIGIGEVKHPLTNEVWGNKASFGISAPETDSFAGRLKDLAGRVFHGEIVLESSTSGLRTKVELRFLCFAGATPERSYIKHNMTISQGDNERLELLEDGNLNFGESLGWISNPRVVGEYST